MFQVLELYQNDKKHVHEKVIQEFKSFSDMLTAMHKQLGIHGVFFYRNSDTPKDTKLVGLTKDGFQLIPYQK